MNALSLSPGLLPWLADVTLQATLLLALPGLIVSLMPRMAAARRHLVLAASLAGVPVLMGCTLLWPEWRLLELTWPAGEPNATMAAPSPHSIRGGAPAGWPASAGMPVDPFQEPVEGSAGALNQADTLHMGGPAAHGPFDWKSPEMIVPGIWLLGAGLGFLGLAVGWMRLRQMERLWPAESDPRILHHFHNSLEQAGLSPARTTLLRADDEACVPMTWGLFTRRFILLPASAQTWSDERLLLVLRHEMGHIMRKDVMVSLLTTASTLLLWFHPLAWWTLKACNAAREAACDDLVLGQSGAPAECVAAELLAAVTTLGGGRRARVFPPPALAMAAAGKAALLRRLEALLTPGQKREPWSRRTARGMIGGIIGLAVLVSGLSACRETKPAAASPAPQVRIACKVFSIPASTAVLEELNLTVRPDGGWSNLGIMSAGLADELAKKVAALKGASLMSAPTVTTRSGQRGTVEVIREFIYPTEFDPPQIPDSLKNGPITLAKGESMPVTPTTPTAFEMKPVGIRMEVEPVVDDGGSIDLNVSPQVTSFTGFINYGSPIMANTVGADGRLEARTLTPNIINQPVFHTARLTTQVRIPSGSSVVMGGLGGPENAENDQFSGKLKPDLNAQASMTGLRSNRTDTLIFFIIEASVMKP